MYLSVGLRTKEEMKASEEEMLRELAVLNEGSIALGDITTAVVKGDTSPAKGTIP